MTRAEVSELCHWVRPTSAAQFDQGTLQSFDGGGAMNRFPAPALALARSLALVALLMIGGSRALAAPASRPAPAALPPVPDDPRQVLEMPADDACAAALAILADGKQSLAEALLEALTRKHPEHARIAFFRAACRRSRFDIDTATEQMRAVARLSSDSVEGRCAKLMADLDTALLTAHFKFEAMMKFAEANADDPLVVWVAAVACRTFKENERGVEWYRRMLKLIAPGQGPVLVHQTMANLLDDLGKYEESMEHRRIAVKLEPAGWSYQGMANTLKAMGKYKEAGEAYAKAVEHQPRSVLYLLQWTHCLGQAQDWPGVVDKAQCVIALDPRNALAWSLRGMGLLNQGKLEEAAASLQKAVDLGLRDRNLLMMLSEIYRMLGEKEKSAEMKRRAEGGR